MSSRKILFWIHLTIGCLAGIVIFIMSVTGVLLAYQRQIISLADRDLHSTAPAPGAVRLPLEEMLAGIVSQNGSAPSAITLHSDAAAAAEVGFGREHVFLVDVYTGRVLGESSPRARSFFQSVENWHRWLGTSDQQRATGRAITGACNLGFLLIAISGPFLWLPRRLSWANIRPIALFRGSLSGRAREFNWHNVTGIWCALPLFVIAFGGVVMSYPWANNLLYRLTGNEVPAQNNGPRPDADSRRTQDPRSKDPRPALSGLDTLWARAEHQVPNWRTLTLRMPPSGRGPWNFTIDTGAPGRPDQRSQLTLDRRTAEVVRWEPFESYNAGRRLRGWLRFLHTGEAGGIAGQTIAGIASAGAALLAWTGLMLACRRLLRWRRRRESMPESSDKGHVTAASR